MSSGKKKYRATIQIPDILQEIHDERVHAQSMIDNNCTYDCYYMDCGYDCPDDCPILKYYDIVEKCLIQEEQDVMRFL